MTIDGLPHNSEDLALAGKILGGIIIVGTWVWRTAVGYTKYKQLSMDFAALRTEISAAGYIKRTDLETFKKACRTEVELSQVTEISQIRLMLGALISKVDILLKERGLEDDSEHDKPRLRRRKTDFTSGFPIQAQDDSGVP